MWRGGEFDCVVALSRRRPHDWRGDWFAADGLDAASLAKAAARLASWGTLMRIVVASGLLHRDDGSVSPEKSIRSLSLKSLTQLFAVNAAGPALVAKHLLPLTLRHQTSLFAALSARVGSIGDNEGR